MHRRISGILLIWTAMTGQLTALFAAYRGGDSSAMDAMIPIVYEELRLMARSHLGRERVDHTLQATALANEAYLKLSQGGEIDIRDRQHFLALASRLMRQILVDHARRKFAGKRGGRSRPIAFDEAAHVDIADNPELVALDDAIEGLAALDKRQAQIVDLRFFGGFSNEEVAGALDCSVSIIPILRASSTAVPRKTAGPISCSSLWMECRSTSTAMSICSICASGSSSSAESVSPSSTRTATSSCTVTSSRRISW